MMESPVNIISDPIANDMNSFHFSAIDHLIDILNEEDRDCSDPERLVTSKLQWCHRLLGHSQAGPRPADRRAEYIESRCLRWNRVRMPHD